MGILVLLVFLVVAIVVIVASIYIYTREKGRTLKMVLILVLIVALPLTWYMTSIYKWEWNENTYTYGCPVPQVVFQRNSPEDPWLDFVGPTIILAYPMNYILYVLPPVVVLLVLSLVANRKPNNRIKTDQQ